MSYNVEDDTSSVGVLTTDSNPYVNVLPDEVTWDTSDIVIDAQVSCDGSDGGFFCDKAVPTIDYYLVIGYGNGFVGGDYMLLDHHYGFLNLQVCFEACRDRLPTCGYFSYYRHDFLGNVCQMWRFSGVSYIQKMLVYKMRSSTGSWEESCRNCKTTFKSFPVFLEDKILAISRTYDGGTGNHRYVHASSNKHPVTFMEYQINDVSVNPTTISYPPSSGRDKYIGFDFRMLYETYRPVHGGTLVNDVGYVLVNNGQVFVASRHCPDCDQNMHSL